MDFKKIQKELRPLLIKLEKKRKPYRLIKSGLLFSVQLFLLFFLLLLVFAIFFGETYNQMMIYLTKIDFPDIHFPVYYIYLIYFLLFAAILLYGKYYMGYEKNKNEVIHAFLKKTFPDFNFYSRKGISLDKVKKSGLFIFRKNQSKKKQAMYSIQSFPLLVGELEGVPLEMGNIKIYGNSKFFNITVALPIVNFIVATYIYLKPWFTKKMSDSITISFQGMFAVAEFNKTIKGRTVILPDFFEKRIGYLAKTLQSMNFERDKLVDLEDIKFEKEFVVYSTDQVEARYILSPALMARITALKRKIDRPIMLSFTGNKLYLAVEHPYGFLSLPENKNLLESDALETFYQDIATAIDIVEDLNLNNKIWV